MPRLTLLLLTLLCAAFPASASAADSLLGVLSDGRAVRFSDDVPTALTTPRAIRGVRSGDRIVALAPGLALGRSGRIYRFDARAVRATATPARVDLSGRAFSIVATAAGGARVLSDDGLDAVADLGSGTVTRGAGLRLADGTPVTPSVAALPDGRLTGMDTDRGTLVTETAPGSGVVTERPMRQAVGRLRFAAPVAFSVAAGGTGYGLSGLPAVKRHRQSRLLRVDLATGAVTGDSGPFFFRELRAVLPLGTAREDVKAPRASFVRAPKRISLRDLQVSGRVRVRVRCSEACIVDAGSAVGGRTNLTSSRSRDTPGTVTVALYRLGGREARLMRARLGRTAILRAFVQDWHHNQRVIEHTFRLTR